MTSTVLKAIEVINPTGNPTLQPSKEFTWCNRFASLVCVYVGAKLGGLFANEQARWLRTQSAVDYGWASATEQVARQWAQAGGLALATWENPEPLKHGHIAVLVPSRPGDPPGVTFIAQAGATNFEHNNLKAGFGNYPVEFHTHSPARAPTNKQETKI